jgi:hypothetical protein
MNVWRGTPYARVFKGSSKRAARLDLSSLSLTVDLNEEADVGGHYILNGELLEVANG